MPRIYPALLQSGRNWNARPKRKRGRDATSFGVGWRNYLAQGDVWSPLSKEMVSDSGSWVSDKLPFLCSIPATSRGTAVFESNNTADIFKKELILDKALVTSIRALGVADVPGRLEDLDGDGIAESVVYVNAYPFGDLIYQLHLGREPQLKKLVRFTSIPARGQTRIQFRINYDSAVDIFEGKVSTRDPLRQPTKWNEAADITGEVDGFSFQARGVATRRGVKLRKFHLWDSSTRHNELFRSDPLRRTIDVPGPIKQSVRVELHSETSARGVTLTKTIPRRFFFQPGIRMPCYTDTIFDADTGAGGIDGYVRNNIDDTGWNSQHDQAAGTTVDETSTTMWICQVEEALGAAWYGMARGFAVYDTSSIDDGDVVDSAEIDMYVSATKDDTTDGSFVVVASSPASNTALATGDFDQCGPLAALSASDRKSANVTIASLTTAAYNTITLDADGEAVIDFTGYSAFGFREDTYDGPDTPIANSNELRVEAETSENTSNNDLDLDVTHSAGSSDVTFVADSQQTVDVVTVSSIDRNIEANTAQTGDLTTELKADRAFVSDAAQTADITADKSIDRNIDVTLDATADFTAVESVDRNLEAQIEGAGELVAEFVTDPDFEAQLEATANLDSSASIDRAIVANSEQSADLVAGASVDRNVNAALDATADLSSDFVTDPDFEAALVAEAVITANLLADRGYLASLEGSGDIASLLAVDRSYIASLEQTADLIALLTTEGVNLVPKTRIRVQETSGTTGTGTFDLSGVVTGYRSFVAAAGNGAKVYYVACDAGSEWEVGIGTITDGSPDTLSRDSIIDSSNAGSLVNFPSGTKHISITRPAGIVEYDYVHLQDQKTSGTSGGTPSGTGSYLRRDINTEVRDSGGICSVASNQFTLVAGIYEVEIRVPVYDAQSARARLQNITDAATTLEGLSVWTRTDTGEETFQYAYVVGRFAITATKTFEVQMRVDVANTNGWGLAHGWGTEVYTDVHIKRIHRDV